MTPDQRNCAVRFDTYTSDWLHERGRRVTVRPGFVELPLTADVIMSVIIGEPTWAPWRQALETTGHLIGTDRARPRRVAPELVLRRRLPPLWDRIHTFWVGPRDQQVRAGPRPSAGVSPLLT